MSGRVLVTGVSGVIGGHVALALLYAAVVAAMNNGTVRMDFNRYHEMWPEIILLGLIALVYPLALRWALRRP